MEFDFDTINALNNQALYHDSEPIQRPVVIVKISLS